MPTIPSTARAVLCAAALLAPGLALAHHPMGGETPTGFVNGLLSGIGHPILGLDHLATFAGVALLAARAKVLWPAGAFGLALMAGVLVHASGFAPAGLEVMVAASAIAVGIALFLAFRSGSTAALAGVAVFGLLHGMALGETVVGAEPTPVIAYLIGLAITQGALLALAVWGLRRLSSTTLAPAYRAAGIAVAFVGSAMLGSALLA